jgi:hypothetical protein
LYIIASIGLFAHIPLELVIAVIQLRQSEYALGFWARATEIEWKKKCLKWMKLWYYWRIHNFKDLASLCVCVCGQFSIFWALFFANVLVLLALKNCRIKIGYHVFEGAKNKKGHPLSQNILILAPKASIMNKP